jgi:hypothetical protein
MQTIRSPSIPFHAMQVYHINEKNHQKNKPQRWIE